MNGVIRALLSVPYSIYTITPKSIILVLPWKEGGRKEERERTDRVIRRL